MSEENPKFRATVHLLSGHLLKTTVFTKDELDRLYSVVGDSGARVHFTDDSGNVVLVPAERVNYVVAVPEKCTCGEEEILNDGHALVRTERIADEDCPVHQPEGGQS